ncbi:hypothetical protein VNO78_15613 [Psophocarpus tetragonolobus]|uniref:Uncharacterized protein n=1 Tax=Psophocarpus tetragonolobus TaxID=3891 RepID=A0AAN9SEW9_PSOTE
MEECGTNVESWVAPLNSEEGSKREEDVEEKEEKVEDAGGGGLINNFISTLVTPLSPSNEKATQHQSVDAGEGGGLVSKMVSNFFHQSEGVVEIMPGEKSKRFKTQNGGIIHNIMARRVHPTSCPSNIEPTRERSWKHFERQREYGDIMSAIQSAMPGAILVGDYVLEDVEVVQQSTTRGDLRQRSARYTMHELIQVVFTRLPEIKVNDREPDFESDMDNGDDEGTLMELDYDVRYAIDIFHFLCYLLNVISIVKSYGSTSHTPNEDVQIFALVFINFGIELSVDEIGKIKIEKERI